MASTSSSSPTVVSLPPGPGEFIETAGEAYASLEGYDDDAGSGASADEGGDDFDMPAPMMRSPLLSDDIKERLANIESEIVDNLAAGRDDADLTDDELDAPAPANATEAEALGWPWSKDKEKESHKADYALDKAQAKAKAKKREAERSARKKEAASSSSPAPVGAAAAAAPLGAFPELEPIGSMPEPRTLATGTPALSAAERNVLDALDAVVVLRQNSHHNSAAVTLPKADYINATVVLAAALATLRVSAPSLSAAQVEKHLATLRPLAAPVKDAKQPLTAAQLANENKLGARTVAALQLLQTSVAGLDEKALTARGAALATYWRAGASRSNVPAMASALSATVELLATRTSGNAKEARGRVAKFWSDKNLAAAAPTWFF